MREYDRNVCRTLTRTLIGDTHQQLSGRSALPQTFLLWVSHEATFASVIDNLPRPHDVSRYRLRTLGTLGLSGPSDRQVLGARRHHRRRLALLSVLAAARDDGRSRDQLLALFWPESTEARARHSLDQLLYAVRSSVSEEVFDGVNPVRLNEECVSSDVGIFLTALDRGDAAGAATEYRGPFLDGFHLDDSPEFERWLELERGNLARRYSSALETLADNAEATGDQRLSVQWWRKLSEADPLSNHYAVGLMRALMRIGDHAAALQCAQRHEAVLARELGMSAGPEVAKLVAELRGASRAPPAGTSTTAAPHVPASPFTSAHEAAEPHDDRQHLRTTPIVQPRAWRTAYIRRAFYAIGIPLVLAAMAAMLSHSRSPREQKSATDERTLAILPLANVSGAPQDMPFADGLSEELIAVLSNVPRIRVIARTSAFAFRNSGLDLRRIADSLGVSYILEGSVQRLGTRLHVQVRLIDAREGVTRWSETYDRELRDVFAMQSDIAAGVARALSLQLGVTTLAHARRGPTSNVAAYELYLRGSDPSLTRSDSTVRAAIGYFEQATALDPRYAAAYAGLARMQLRLANGNDTTMPRRERLRLGEAAALTAVALDDSLAEAHAALGEVKRNSYDFESTEAELTRAVRLEPRTARFHEFLVQLYVWMDRPADALAEARRAVELDPLSPTANAELAHALLANGRCDEALARLAPLRLLRPPLLRANSIAAHCYASKGMWPEAIAEVRQSATTAGPRGKSLLGFLLARAGRTTEAQQVIASLRERSGRRGDVAGEIAIVYAGLGDKEQTWAWLEQARETHTLVLDDLSLVLDRLRPDPRVDLFRRQLGLLRR